MESIPLTICVVGASGHLARTKILPALFALYCQGHLPERFCIVGYARSALSDLEFRERVSQHLTCRYTPAQSCEDLMQKFLERCSYCCGQYDRPDDFAALKERVEGLHAGVAGHLLVYLAIPPQVFPLAAKAMGTAGIACDGQDGRWTRLVIEKPFGRDRESSDQLTREIGEEFSETQTFRIDHYLGKEVIQNLLVLRFANLIFEPIWNRHYIKSVEITWKEDLTIEGRGGYFDNTGIIRDVMQNHLLQILALVSMEAPARLEADHIQNAKVNALLCVPPPTMDDVVIAQYGASRNGDRDIPGYRDDASVASDSVTPTYAAVALRVDNQRWDGVPFLMRAGKGLDGRMTEIRIRFREIPGATFDHEETPPAPNELVIRVQPDAAIYFNIMNKVPGLGMKLEPRMLDLQYDLAFSEAIPDAYEDLLLDVIRGDKSLFIRSDELAAAWDIFTPMLQEIDTRHLSPETYEFGARGPEASDQLAAGHGVTWE
jgi:glucose-6-phosphate 1-dehydrogenase